MGTWAEKVNSRSRVPGRSGESKKGRPQFKHVSIRRHTNMGVPDSNRGEMRDC